MPEPASNAPAIPEATSRRRLYRRPWVLLSLAGLAVFGSIPFAIRGYQLSLIPDIPDPFADQPEVEIREHNAAASDVIEQFLRGYERLDEELWIGNEKPDYEDHKQFLSELSEASQQGLDGATPRVKKYFQENRDLIGLWFNLLDMGAIAPIEQQRPAYPGFYAATSRELLDLLSIAAISQVDSGDPQAAMKLALTAVRKLNRASVQDFGAWRGLYFARVRVWKLIAELSQRPVVNEAVLADCLGVALSLSAASDEFRILELQVEYAATVEHFDDSDLTWVSAKFLSLPEWTGSMSAYVLGEPTLSK